MKNDEKNPIREEIGNTTAEIVAHYMDTKKPLSLSQIKLDLERLEDLRVRRRTILHGPTPPILVITIEMVLKIGITEIAKKLEKQNISKQEFQEIKKLFSEIDKHKYIGDEERLQLNKIGEKLDKIEIVETKSEIKIPKPPPSFLDKLRAVFNPFKSAESDDLELEGTKKDNKNSPR